jgi:hypothetical protein
MKTKVQNSASLLLVAALTLFSAGIAAAQTTATMSTTESTSTTSTQTKTVASTDSTAVTSVGLNAGVTSLAGDSNGNVYASLQYSNKVVKLNGGGTVIGTFAVGRNPTGMFVDNANGVLYVLNNADNTITKLRLDGTPVATFKVAGDGPVHAALYGGVLYVACERSNSLVRLSAADGTALGSTDVGARPVWVVVGVTTTKYSTSSGPVLTADSAMASDSTMASEPTISEEPTTDSTASSTDGESTTVDASTMDGSTTSSDGSMMVADSDAMSSDSMTTSSRTTTKTTVSVYVSCNKANQVWKLSSAGGVLGQFTTGRGPFGLALNSRGELLVACFWDSAVQRLSSAGALLSRTAVGDGAAGMIPYGNVVAVISNGANTITRLSLSDGTVISKDLVDRSPLIGAATSSALWVACTGNGTIAKRAL